MFYMHIFSAFKNILFYGLFTHTFMMCYFPKKYNFFILELAHFSILTYTKARLYIGNKYKELKKTNASFRKYTNQIEDVYTFFFKIFDKGNIEIIKDDQILFNTSTALVGKNTPLFMDFMIYTDNSMNGEPRNKVIYYSKPSNFDYEKCKYKFISLTISFSDTETYKLKLFSEHENYYIVNNKLNKNVFCYLLKSRYNVSKNDKDGLIKYKLELIDQNVNIKNLTEKNEIILHKDHYSILEFD